MGLREERDARTKDFDRWCRETTGGGFSSGSISESVGEYYDSITGDEDLRPKAARRIGTVIAEGSPVENAEIVLFILGESQRHEVYVEHGRLRDPAFQRSKLSPASVTGLNPAMTLDPVAKLVKARGVSDMRCQSIHNPDAAYSLYDKAVPAQ